MDKTKLATINALIKERGYVYTQTRVLVTREEFFDGNDDPGSIGCNLLEHPGVEVFDKAFQRIEKMDGVDGVYFAITEVDEKWGNWPFTDTAWIVTRLEPSAFKNILKPLRPDEIGEFDEAFMNPPVIPEGYKLIQVWWD